MIGVHDMESVQSTNFGQNEALRICIYRDVNISEAQAHEIIAEMKDEFAQFNIDIQVPWITDWERPGFTWDEILTDVASRPLEAPCDRQFAMVGRDFKDFIWGVIMPEWHGAVETHTMTKGFAVAEWGSLNQLASLKSPKETAVHEVYHLLGCSHDLDANVCHAQISRIKDAARKNRAMGRDFFPSMNFDGKTFWNRTEINRQFGAESDAPNCDSVNETAGGPC
jgi:hypothetical protein